MMGHDRSCHLFMHISSSRLTTHADFVQTCSRHVHSSDLSAVSFSPSTKYVKTCGQIAKKPESVRKRAVVSSELLIGTGSSCQ